MREITPDVEELHQIIGVGNFEDTGYTGSNTYNLAFRIVDSDWLAAHDAEVARKTLEDALSDIHKQAVAELNGKRHGNSTAVRTAFGSGAELAKRILRARAASISTDKAGAGE